MIGVVGWLAGWLWLWLQSGGNGYTQFRAGGINFAEYLPLITDNVARFVNLSTPVSANSTTSLLECSQSGLVLPLGAQQVPIWPNDCRILRTTVSALASLQATAFARS